MYTYCANNPIHYSDPTGHVAVVDDIVIAAAILVAGVVTTALSQPEVQEGLSTMINKASYAVEEFAENAASVIASAAISVASAVSEVTGISSAPVLAPPTGLKKKFSTITDSNYNPYLAPWLYASMGSQSIAKDGADSIEKNIDIPYLPIKKPVFFPVNPDNFNPKGMLRSTYDTPNGLVIKWGYTNKVALFEWNEDIKMGDHYHCILPEWKNKHSESGKSKDVIHYRAGQIIPEPWASWYRGY